MQSELGKAFTAAQSRYKDKVRLVKLDASSEEGKEAAAQTGLKNPPISVLLNSKGEVADKFEGSRSSKEIGRKLSDLLKR